MVTLGFTGKLSADYSDLIPRSQHPVKNFLVLTDGPPPQVSLGDWSFTPKIGQRPVKRWTWAEFHGPPRSKMTRHSLP